MVRAWYLDDSTEDQRLEHYKYPGIFVSLEKLDELGILYRKFNPETYREDEQFAKIRKERGYTYEDTVTVSREALPNYEEKLKIFYIEHFHGFEEIRFVLEGSGYFDVRDENDEWIRIEIEAGDFLAMPAGSCHRFTLDVKNYIKALRMFVSGPDPPHHHLPEDEQMKCRVDYLKSTRKISKSA